MKVILTTFLILSVLLFLLIDAIPTPATGEGTELQKRDTPIEPTESSDSKRLERRDGAKPGRRKQPGRKKRKKKLEGLPKYFNEPGGSELGNHYDSRFEHGIQDYADRKNTQLHMLRAYLTFFHENHLETWLAHGTLLGWWWNGRMLPWDWDIDTQVSGSTLNYLGAHYNQSHYEYESNEDTSVKRTYLLDVNPAIKERERGNGNNIIDARWIDTRNGLYIDITGLSETHPDDQPGVWVCKNYHRYQTMDLYPMRETMYEGVVAKVPYAYDRILTKEYSSNALVLTDYEGHRWDPIVKEWLPKSDEELAEDKREGEEKEREKKAREQEEKERETEEEMHRRVEEGKRKKAEEREARAKDEVKNEMEKQKADKQAEVKRQREMQQRFKASSAGDQHSHGPDHGHKDGGALGPQEPKKGEQMQHTDAHKVQPPAEPSRDTSQASKPGDVFKQENLSTNEEGSLGPERGRQEFS
ncbi:MAG: hypothetical protein Q9218_007239 [Villophora microphyllina]